MAKASSSHPAGGSPRFIDDGYLELTQVIGTGAYGCVWLAIDARYPHLPWRAVKALRRTGLDARQKQFQIREMTSHALASNHSSIITMDRIVEEGEFVYVVMDYGEDGDLFSMIIDRRRYVGDDDLIRSVFLQLLDGIAHIHKLGIAHRDIKPENIVCSDDGARVRICDFGLATAEIHSTEFGCGSTFYIAPECLGDWKPKRTSYPTKAGDVWSLGVILVNLISSRNPWRIASPKDESFNAFLADPTFLRRILPISNDCLEILKSILVLDPLQRISLAELRKKIINIPSFSMSEEEVNNAHASARAAAANQKVLGQKFVPKQPILDDLEMEEINDGESLWSSECEDDIPFDLEEDLDMDSDNLPSLRSDSGSPSPPHLISRSSTCSTLPPTPLLVAADGIATFPTEANTKVWETCKGPTAIRIRNEYHLSPDSVTAGSPNPFFRYKI